MASGGEGGGFDLPNSVSSGGMPWRAHAWRRPRICGGGMYMARPASGGVGERRPGAHRAAAATPRSSHVQYRLALYIVISKPTFGAAFL